MENNKPAIKKNKIIVYNPKFRSKDSKRLSIIRVLMDDELTRIDLVYNLSFNQKKPIFFQIDSNCFITPSHSNKVYKFIKAENIPVLPNIGYIKPGTVSISFSLFFEGLDKKCNTFDLIEDFGDDKKYFNIYKISLNRTFKYPELILN